MEGLGSRVDRSLGYRPALDGVRAVAIGLVLLNHTGLDLFEGGGNGVIVFFVLSGFLITKLMIEEWSRDGDVSIRNFYGRRAVRILPAPTVMLLTVLAMSWYITDSPAQHGYVLREIGLSATYLMNMRPLFVDQIVVGGELYGGFLGHMWSLAVEEQFYLIWPWAVVALALPARRSRRVIGTLAAIAVTVAVVRLAFMYVSWLNPDVASISLFSFDGFAIGAALAFALHHGTFPALERVLARPLTAIAGLAVLGADLLGGPISREIDTLYFFYCSVAAAAIIGHLFVRPTGFVGGLASLGPVVFIGKLSYSIYLWHNPIWVFVSSDRFPELSMPVLTGIEWTLTAIAVLFSYYVIERPAMRWRRRFTRRRDARRSEQALAVG